MRASSTCRCRSRQGRELWVAQERYQFVGRAVSEELVLVGRPIDRIEKEIFASHFAERAPHAPPSHHAEATVAVIAGFANCWSMLEKPQVPYPLR